MTSKTVLLTDTLKHRYTIDASINQPDIIVFNVDKDDLQCLDTGEGFNVRVVSGAIVSEEVLGKVRAMSTKPVKTGKKSKKAPSGTIPVEQAEE